LANQLILQTNKMGLNICSVNNLIMTEQLCDMFIWMDILYVRILTITSRF